MGGAVMTTYHSLRNLGLVGGLGGAVPLSDDFNRPDSTDLGLTSVGNRPWEKLVGGWDIFSNQIRNVSGTNPVAVVDAYTPDVDISLDIYSASQDAIIFRASDANNWLRLANYYTSVTSTTTEWEWRQCYNGTSEGHLHNDTHCTTGWGSFSTPPSFPSTFGHLHTVDGVNVIHNHPTGGASPTKTGNTRQVSVGTTTTRRVYLHKMQSSTLTQLNLWSVSTTSRLRVVAAGPSLFIYAGTGTTLVDTVSESFNLTATRHGVGQSELGSSFGSAMDNFSLTPFE